MVLGGREASAPCRHALSNVASPKARATCKPSCQWLCVLKDARPCRIFQCRCLSNLAGANSHRRSLSLLSTPRENCSCPKATRDHARPCCPCSRVAPCSPQPWRITASTRELVRVTQSCPSQSHSRLAFARPNIANGSARMKDPSLPQVRSFTASFSKFSILLITLAN